jgi:hypothetical protein
MADRRLLTKASGAALPERSGTHGPPPRRSPSPLPRLHRLVRASYEPGTEPNGCQVCQRDLEGSGNGVGAALVLG